MKKSIPYEEIPAIKSALPTNQGLYILWENGEFRFLTKNDFAVDIHSKSMIKKGIWEHIEVEKYTIYWTKYKLSGQAVGVGHDTLYDISENIDSSKNNLCR